MHFSFWEMTPGDALFSEIDRITEGRQRRFFLMIAEEALEYNKKYDTHYTFGEFKDLCYPGGMSPIESHQDDETTDYPTAEPE